MAFALGLNLTVSRMASVIGGIIIPRLISNDTNELGEHLVDSTMQVGFWLCVISLIAGILLVLIDKYAD